VYSQNSIDIVASPNWMRYAFFDRKQRKTVKHNSYGLYATYSRFTPYVKDKEPGRNDPCPCGSGKKFKNCHGKGIV